MRRVGTRLPFPAAATCCSSPSSPTPRHPARCTPAAARLTPTLALAPAPTRSCWSSISRACWSRWAAAAAPPPSRSLRRRPNAGHRPGSVRLLRVGRPLLPPVRRRGADADAARACLPRRAPVHDDADRPRHGRLERPRVPDLLDDGVEPAVRQLRLRRDVDTLG